MQFFTDCKTKIEAKATFRKLSKCFHPDKDGENELMIELKKQFDAWSPEAKATIKAEEPISFHGTPVYEVNPRVELLEKELAKLRRQIANPPLERENAKLKSQMEKIFNLLEQKQKEQSELNDIRYNYASKIVMKEKENEDLHTLLQNNLTTIQEQKIEIENLEAQIAAIPKVEQDLTLWQKIKYVIGDKSVKRYN